MQGENVVIREQMLIQYRNVDAVKEKYIDGKEEMFSTLPWAWF